MKFSLFQGGKIFINLICSFGQEDSKLNPVSYNKDDLVFSIKTPLVCEPPTINCLVLLFLYYHLLCCKLTTFNCYI